MTGAEIAEVLEMAPSTVSGILRRIGLGKLSRLEPAEPPNRYERSRAGELLHIDVKKLGRIGRGGWEFVHVCVDDAARIAYVEVLADEKRKTAIGFLRRAVAYYRALGIAVEAVMTDNGGAYVSSMHAIACRVMGLRHIRTRPYRPRTNGKAERFIRTMLCGSSRWLARLLQSPTKTRLPRSPPAI